MSHVDDGTLHAYLDGELSPVEVERLDTHVAGCSVCRARLDEERALIDRAARLLGMAVPPGPERVAPPLHQLQRRASTWSRLRVPLAWAATVVLAVSIGWYAGSFTRRGSPVASSDSVPPTAGHVAIQVDRPTERQAPATVIDQQTSTQAPAAEAQARANASGAGAVSALADRAREESDERRQAARAAAPVSPPPSPTPAAAELPRDRESLTVRGAALPSPAASGSIAIAPNNGAVHAYRDAASVRLSTSWPVIEAKPARDLLGTAPAVIPGFAIRSMRRNPGTKQIVVEQEIEGALVSLFEQPVVQGQAMQMEGRNDVDNLTAKAALNERLARFVGGLRVEIAGALPMDSLSKLLELVRP